MESSPSSSHTSDSESHSSATYIPIFRLLLTTVGPFILLCISSYLHLGLGKKIVMGLLRSSIQLFLLGYVLLGFIFSFKSPFAVFLYLFFMILIAALEATSRQIRTYDRHYWDSYLSCLVGGGLVGLYAALVVFDPSPWWYPPVLVPTAGMIIGNSVSGPAVAVDRLLSEIADKRHESETRLAFGATGYESVLHVVRAAIQAALLPTLNQMAIMGLVSIPGMMTGQLLGGTPPYIAAEYQMAILYLILTTTSLSSFSGVLLAIRHAIFDDNHRLTPNKIIKRVDGKMDIDIAIYRLASQAISGAGTCFVLAGNKIQNVLGKNNTKALSQSYEQLSSESIHGSELSSEDVELANIKKTAERKSDFVILDDSEDIRNEDSDEQTSTGRAESEANQIEKDDGLPARTSFRVIENSTAYSPHSPVAEASASSAAFFVLKGVNVLSGEGKLFQKGFNLSVRRGERLTLEGPSGIGKTRLLRALSQLDAPNNGTMSFCGKGVLTETFNRTSASASLTIPEWRCRVIYVPQALPPMAGSPKDLVAECCSFASRAAVAGALVIKTDLDGQCSRLEQSLRLREGLLSSAWNTLSGGERQRAAIAVGLLLACAMDSSQKNPMQPPADNQALSANEIFPDALLLLDEPTAACDPDTTLAVEKALVASGAAMILITHDDRQAKRIAHRRILLTAAL